MNRKSITVAQDENFHEEITLVAIEPVSKFIILEKQVADRSAETWSSELTLALKGIDVKIISSASDEAKGIISSVERDFGVIHSPNIFHFMRELSRHTLAPLRTRLRASETASSRFQQEFLRLQQAQIS